LFMPDCFGKSLPTRISQQAASDIQENWK